MVAETHRRQGIGTKLLDEAVAWARTVGCESSSCTSFPGTSPRYICTRRSDSSARATGSSTTLVERSLSTRSSWRTSSSRIGPQLNQACRRSAPHAVGHHDAQEEPVGKPATRPGAAHAEKHHEVEEPHHLVMTRSGGLHTSAPRSGTTSAWPASSNGRLLGARRLGRIRLELLEARLDLVGQQIDLGENRLAVCRAPSPHAPRAAREHAARVVGDPHPGRARIPDPDRRFRWSPACGRLVHAAPRRRVSPLAPGRPARSGSEAVDEVSKLGDLVLRALAI